MNRAPEGKGRNRCGIAAACAFAILLVSQAASARSTEPEETLLVPVPGNADLSTTLKPAPQDIKVLSGLTIQKGDSLWRISRRTLGRGSYYPQILAFNQIENPDRIYEGRALFMPAGPLTRHPELASRFAGKSATIVFPAVAGLAGAEPALIPPSRMSREAEPRPKAVGGKKTASVSAGAARKENGGETEVRAIITLADQGKCRDVVDAVDRFLARHPDSAHLATLLWHQAECYRAMSTSGQ